MTRYLFSEIVQVISNKREQNIEYLTPTMLANSVYTKFRPFTLIAIPVCKIIVDALGQGVHCFLSFFFINIEQILSNEFLKDKSLMKQYYKNNCEFHEIVTK